MRHYYILFVLSLLLTNIISGQELWTLERCIEYAWKNNLQIKQKEINVESSRNTLSQSKYGLLPTLNASIGEDINLGKSVNINDLKISNETQTSTAAAISSSLTLFNGLSKINTIRGNIVAVDISLQGVEQLKNEISVSIAQAFLQVLLSEQVLAVCQENLNSILDQRNRTKLLVEAGSQSYSSLLDIESQLASERVQVVTAENNVKKNLLSLLQLLDLPYSEDFIISAPNIDDNMPQTIIESVDSIYINATSLPEIRAAELGLQKSRLDLAAAKGYYYPNISLTAGYGSYYSSTIEAAFFSQFNENRNPSLGFNMSIPIFNGYSVGTKVRNAKLNVKRSEIELKNSHQTLYKNIQSAVLEAASIYHKYIASKSNLKATEESFRYIEQKFNVGAVNSTDYIVSKANLFKAQSEYLQSKYQYLFQLKIIDLYKGKQISL